MKTADIQKLITTPATGHVLQANYILVGCVCLVALIFFYRKWDFIQEVLSENGKGSSKRVGGFMLTITYCICLLMTVAKTGVFGLYLAIATLVTICLCWSIAEFKQIIDVYKNRGGTTTTAATTTTANTEVIKTEIKIEEPPKPTE